MNEKGLYEYGQHSENIDHFQSFWIISPAKRGIYVKIIFISPWKHM